MAKVVSAHVPIKWGTQAKWNGRWKLMLLGNSGSWLKCGKILRLLQICQWSREAGRKVTCNISAFFPEKFYVNSGSTRLIFKLTLWHWFCSRRKNWWGAQVDTSALNHSVFQRWAFPQKEYLFLHLHRWVSDNISFSNFRCILMDLEKSLAFSPLMTRIKLLIQVSSKSFGQSFLQYTVKSSQYHIVKEEIVTMLFTELLDMVKHLP